MKKISIQFTKTQLYIGAFAALSSIASTILFWSAETFIYATPRPNDSVILEGIGSWFAFIGWVMWAVFGIVTILHVVTRKK